jgi:hypothetical protein
VGLQPVEDSALRHSQNRRGFGPTCGGGSGRDAGLDGCGHLSNSPLAPAFLTAIRAGDAALTTGFAGPYDLVAAIVMAILAGVLVWVSVYIPPWLGWCLRILAAFLIIVAARAAWTEFRQDSEWH